MATPPTMTPKRARRYRSTCLRIGVSFGRWIKAPKCTSLLWTMTFRAGTGTSARFSWISTLFMMAFGSLISKTEAPRDVAVKKAAMKKRSRIPSKTTTTAPSSMPPMKA